MEESSAPRPGPLLVLTVWIIRRLCLPFGRSPWCRGSEPECGPRVEQEGQAVERHVRPRLVPRGAAAQSRNAAHASNCEEDGGIAMDGSPAAFACPFLFTLK